MSSAQEQMFEVGALKLQNRAEHGPLVTTQSSDGIDLYFHQDSLSQNLVMLPTRPRGSESVVIDAELDPAHFSDGSSEAEFLLSNRTPEQTGAVAAALVGSPRVFEMAFREGCQLLDRKPIAFDDPIMTKNDNQIMVPPQRIFIKADASDNQPGSRTQFKLNSLACAGDCPAKQGCVHYDPEIPITET